MESVAVSSAIDFSAHGCGPGAFSCGQRQTRCMQLVTKIVKNMSTLPNRNTASTIMVELSAPGPVRQRNCIFFCQHHEAAWPLATSDATSNCPDLCYAPDAQETSSVNN